MIRMYTTGSCPDCYAAKRFLKERRIEFEEINIEGDPSVIEYVKSVNGGKRSVPTFEIEGRVFSCSPFNARKLQQMLDLSLGASSCQADESK